MRFLTAALALAALVALQAFAVAAEPAAPPRLPPPLVDATPGTLLSHEPIDTPIAGALAWQVRYVSADVNGVAHEVSGLVIAIHEPRLRV